MKILFADKFPQDGVDQLHELGHECDLQPDLVGETLPAAIGESEILVVRSTKVSADTIRSRRIPTANHSGRCRHEYDRQGVRGEPFDSCL